MKRLPAQIGITYFSVLAAAFYLSDQIIWIVGCAALLISALFLMIRKLRRTVYLPAMALAALLACAVNLGYTACFVQPVRELYADSVHTVRAVLTDEPYHAYSKYYYKLKTVEIDGEKVSRKLLLKTYSDIDAEPDDVLSFTSELTTSDNNYYRAKGYYLVSDSFDTKIDTQPAASHSLYYYAIQLRRSMRKALESYLPSDCAALCRAVLIGDKYALDLKVRDRFRYAGASYFVVVSGMHFAVICMIAMYLFRRMHRWVRFGVMLMFITVYAAVTGFQASVVRAMIMMFFMILAFAIRRQTYPLNHLGLAGIIMPFFVTPYGAGDIGLILSFYATLAILLWAEPIARKLCYTDEYGNIPQFHIGSWVHTLTKFLSGRFKSEGNPKKKHHSFDFVSLRHKMRNTVCSLIAVSLAANILIFPISVFVFHGFSVVTLLSALLLYAQIYLILILAFLLCVFSWFKPLALVLSFPLIGLCRLVLWIVNMLGSLPFAYYRVSSAFIYIWVGITILLWIAVLLYRNNYRFLKLAALCSAAVLLAGCVTHGILQSQVMMLEVYSCSDGICAAINCRGDLHLLHMDAKSQDMYRIWRELSERYGSAGTALCGDMRELRNCRMYRQDEFAISSIMLYDKDGYDEGDNVVGFDSDRVFVLDDDLILRVSIVGGVAVPCVSAGNKRVLLIPDNCSFEDIPDGLLQADVIILSHAVEGMDRLRCDDLIISDNSDIAYHTADLLKDCYQHVSVTADGDVRCRLR